MSRAATAERRSASGTLSLSSTLSAPRIEPQDFGELLGREGRDCPPGL